MNSLSQLIKALGFARLAALVATGLLALGFVIYLMSRFTQPDMALLYGELDPSDSSQIIGKLEAMGVPHRIGGSGSQIFVGAEDVPRLRLAMAESGLPSGGSVGYEIFDRSEGLGSSSFVQNVNRLRALEGELARTIRTIAQVKAARVHLALPQRQLFSRTSQEPTASIVLQLQGGTRLSTGEVRAVQSLTAAAVPNLSPQNVSIVDTRGELLARGGDAEDGTHLAVANAQEMRQAYEHRFARKIEELLERSLGPGTVRAQVSATIDFDRVSTSEELFDPDSQVVRSTQTVEETTASSDGEKTQAVSVSEELPPTEPIEETPEKLSTANTSRTEETVNYEISKVVKNHVRESGTVKRLSVAVLVDGTYGAAGPNGERQYAPRSKEDMERITALVRSAIGYDESRGDVVEVVNMRFVEPEMPVADSYSPLLDLNKSDLFRIGEVLLLLVTAVLAILFVVRPVLQRILDLVPRAPHPGEAQARLTDGSGAAGALPNPEQAGDSGAMIDIDQIEGKVKASSLRKVNEIVQKHPEESVAILRNWMFNEG